jgi:hypothetical protein
MATETERLPLPPYVSWKTFLNLIERLKGTSVPNRIDPSVLRSYAGSVGRQLVVTLKYLNLIEEGGRTNERLKKLVASYDTTEWQEALTEVLFDAYSDVHSGVENLDEATYRELQDAFRRVGADGAVLDKCISFWIGGMISCGTTVSPHIVNRPKARSTARNGKPRKASKPAVDPTDHTQAEPNPVAGPQSGYAKFSFPVPGKASATIYVPADLATDDWEMIDAMIRAYVTRRNKT